jgi:hypothetical protein
MNKRSVPEAEPWLWWWFAHVPGCQLFGSNTAKGVHVKQSIGAYALTDRPVSLARRGLGRPMLCVFDSRKPYIAIIGPFGDESHPLFGSCWPALPSRGYADL